MDCKEINLAMLFYFIFGRRQLPILASLGRVGGWGEEAGGRQSGWPCPSLTGTSASWVHIQEPAERVGVEPCSVSKWQRRVPTALVTRVRAVAACWAWGRSALKGTCPRLSPQDHDNIPFIVLTRCLVMCYFFLSLITTL